MQPNQAWRALPNTQAWSWPPPDAKQLNMGAYFLLFPPLLSGNIALDLVNIVSFNIPFHMCLPCSD